MSYIKNVLSRDSRLEAVEAFHLLKGAAMENPTSDLILSLLALPSMVAQEEFKISILIAAVQDGMVTDGIIESLCKMISGLSPGIWSEKVDDIKAFISGSEFLKFTRRQKLLLAHTFEVLFAKGFDDSRELAMKAYCQISPQNVEFAPYSDENVRIRLARLAYGCHMNNWQEVLGEIFRFKKTIKKAHYGHLKGMVSYYIGIALANSVKEIDKKDAGYYIAGANCKRFPLAAIYLSYHPQKVETSILGRSCF